ncbi:glutamate ABC transporter substrate-binding protein [Streptosporangium sp. NBC_01639]|uniref:glutamate ABC transporter substrate-binding protein n=1 Tax=unclassified Streptosporangium TaxID=2632669 RepID=UPI002DDA0E18|nr:glutamate ABC transporter substrate-binding protein [Streptosporangium sp. NBC_01756]WSC87442.1 glutamate ABC transporter substrate-binding protein [Streptosporangium sp. NBC_01756]WTD53875.1 glutamate ABC transporter substrate-binding protein [Streptosporangium sp. NBC_01639]
MVSMKRMAAVAAVSMIGLSACSGTDSGSPAVPGEAKGGDLLAKAPVAAAADILPGSTMEKIKQRGELIVGGSLDAPLLSQQNPTTGEVEGFDADMGKALAKYIIGEPKVKIVNSASETREALLSNGTVDVVFQTYTITPERAEQVAFAGPYYSSGLTLAVRKGTAGIAKPEDLNGKTVIAGANTPAIPAIKKIAPQAKIVTFGSDPECMQALKQERGDAYVQDETLLVANAKKDPSVQVVGSPFTTDPYGIGLKHGDDQFKKFVNDWLKKIQADGLWQQTWKNSIGTVVQGEAPTPPQIGSVPGS